MGLRNWRTACTTGIAVVLSLMLCMPVAKTDANGASSDANQTTEDRSERLKYILHCAGCHNEDGSAEPGIVPKMKGDISKFLAVEEGRIFLIQAPGAANSYLNDGELASLLNWVVREFDVEHIPVDFEPYTAIEVARHRGTAVSNARKTREALIRKLESSGHVTPEPY